MAGGDNQRVSIENPRSFADVGRMMRQIQGDLDVIADQVDDLRMKAAGESAVQTFKNYAYPIILGVFTLAVTIWVARGGR